MKTELEDMAHSLNGATGNVNRENMSRNILDVCKMYRSIENFTSFLKIYQADLYEKSTLSLYNYNIILRK